MKTKKLAVLLLLVAIVAAGAWWWSDRQRASATPLFRVALVERGTLTATVAASGTLAPTVQVQVGSQVSGQIQEVLADFNDEVVTGQVIARLDPQSIEYRVRQIEADVEASRAQVAVQQATVMARRADLARAAGNLDEARRDLDRKAQLVERNFISPAERDRAAALVRTVGQELKSAQAQVQLAESQVRSAQAIVRQREAQLAQSQIDLERTVIRAPVDGVVIKRSIQPGQTVAASLQAPELFIIAQNLRDMQVDVAIDEAEVSRVRVGQVASFTVDAFPGRRFDGTVRQVRKAAQNVQNVITYTAVVSATNETLSLLPGMTANVRIVTDVRHDALKVPNAALRFRPPGWVEPAGVPRGGPGSAGEQPATAAGTVDSRVAGGRADGAVALLLPIGAAHAAGAGAATAPGAGAGARTGGGQGAEAGGRPGSRNVARGRVFVPGADGTPRPVEVRLGLSDGMATEVLGTFGDARLEEGDSVYIGTLSARPAARSGPGQGGGSPRMRF